MQSWISRGQISPCKTYLNVYKPSEGPSHCERSLTYSDHAVLTLEDQKDTIFDNMLYLHDDDGQQAFFINRSLSLDAVRYLCAEAHQLSEDTLIRSSYQRATTFVYLDAKNDPIAVCSVCN